ncbi:hypothetical protein NP603_21620 [Methylomonas sp. SURF-1]|uniref:Uncharacterized protein n=1 Tax=Methylomonas aurea TaxID=2952224 RepID=A0ABT1UNL2_9GAMM|nr:hypothetical protein [Methylomonas sp. SURF-1]MCQ8183717.1 hypothetical protein [Methylomonas sp. SURF-1]
MREKTTDFPLAAQLPVSLHDPMPKPKPLLTELAKKGKPLVEVVVIPFDEQQSEDVCRILDDLALDISAEILPAYFQPSEIPTIYQIRLEATKEALLREFGWKIERIQIYDTKEDNGQYPDAYAWEDLNEPEFYPEELSGKIKHMGLTQPGNSDNGKLDNINYELKNG